MRLLLFTTLLITAAHAQSFWDSDHPDYIDQFIYYEVSNQCENFQEIDKLIADEVISYPMGSTYTATFEANGKWDGFIAIDHTFQGDLYLSDLECPQFKK